MLRLVDWSSGRFVVGIRLQLVNWAAAPGFGYVRDTRPTALEHK
jgi:hypothetical protein